MVYFSKDVGIDVEEKSPSLRFLHVLLTVQADGTVEYRPFNPNVAYSCFLQDVHLYTVHGT